ncbi:MAG: radical SAM protein [Anaerolineae bacterium]
MTPFAPVAGFLAMQVRSRLLRQRRSLLAGYKLTSRCNLICAHCPFWRRRSPDLGFAGVTGVLDRLHAAGARLLVLEGGEPLLWRDGSHGFDDVVRYAKRLFWTVGVTTNGTLPLPQTPDVVWVSIDGLEETTRRIRGDVFATQMERLAASQHRRLYANITINAWNVGEVPALVRHLADRVRGITVQFYYPYEGESELVVPWDRRAQVLDELIAAKRAGLPLLDSVAALRGLKRPGWRCHPWLVASAEPDGAITQGCYLKGRGPIACDLCGFAAHLEMSLAYDFHPAAMAAGIRIFGLLPGLG